ncbi:MAG: Rpn family recombination-promoting nuclease/putative transposase, partial [Muribaculaceae bacterium]|nr:Rpn family recombination-promoting nuclease/putative transposase [Muribaculaceae bacterium]
FMNTDNKELFMNLRTDFAFKRLFGTPQYSHLLLRLLNGIFQDNKKISRVEFKNKEVLPPDIDGKKMVYDVYFTTQDDEHFILEMQNLYEPYFENRAILYTLKGLTEQVKRGGEYYLDPVYSIFFTNFDFTHIKKGISHNIGLIDRHTGEVFSELLNMRFIPMSTVKEFWEECENDYDQIIYLIKNMHKMDKNSKAYQSGEYDDFFKAAELNNLVEEDFVAYSQSYAKMEETERAMQFAVSESYSNGFSKGELVGIRKTAINLKKMGLKPETISQATGLTQEEVSAL